MCRALGFTVKSDPHERDICHVTLKLDAEEMTRLESLLDRKAPSGDPEQGNKGASP